MWSVRALFVIVLESEYARMFECRIITSDNESLKMWDSDSGRMRG